MAYADTYGALDRASDRSGRNGGGVMGIVAQVRAWFDERARYVRTRDELMSLTDRELEDIGLHRADVERIARDSARLA